MNPGMISANFSTTEALRLGKDTAIRITTMAAEATFGFAHRSGAVRSGVVSRIFAERIVTRHSRDIDFRNPVNVVPDATDRGGGAVLNRNAADPVGIGNSK